MPPRTALRAKRLNRNTGPSVLIQSVIDGLLDGAELSFYTASRPANNSTDPSGVTLLATLTVAYPNGAPLSGLISSTAIHLNVLGGFVYVSGSANWARLRTADGMLVYDADVGTGSAGINKIVVNSSVAWTAGQAITIPSIIVSESGIPAMNLYVSGTITVS